MRERGELGNRMRRLTIRAGTLIRPRDRSLRTERARKDHNVLAMPSTAPGGVRCWSIKRGQNRHEVQWWYVLAEDVRDPEDFPDAEGYVR